MASWRSDNAVLRRSRLIRDGTRYWSTREVMDQAVQTLYWACRQNRGFPGTIPDESSGSVSTDAILRGLGLTPPSARMAEELGVNAESQTDGVRLSSGRTYRGPSSVSEDMNSAAGVPTEEASELLPQHHRPVHNQVIEERQLHLGHGIAQGVGGSEGIPMLMGYGQSYHMMMDGGTTDPLLMDEHNVEVGYDSLAHPIIDRRGSGDPGQHFHGAPRPTGTHDGVMVDGHSDTDWNRQPIQRISGRLPWPGTLAAVQTETVLGIGGPSSEQKPPKN